MAVRVRGDVVNERAFLWGRNLSGQKGPKLLMPYLSLMVTTGNYTDTVTPQYML